MSFQSEYAPSAPIAIIAPVLEDGGDFDVRVALEGGDSYILQLRFVASEVSRGHLYLSRQGLVNLRDGLNALLKEDS